MQRGLTSSSVLREVVRSVTIGDEFRQSKLCSQTQSECSPLSRGARDMSSRYAIDSYAKGLAAMLQDSSLPVPLLMGVHGKKGSGKTHLIKAVLWKIGRICSFSCSNLDRLKEPVSVNWRYNLCGCNVSFFGFLFVIFAATILAVCGVVSFMLWAIWSLSYSTVDAHTADAIEAGRVNDSHVSPATVRSELVSVSGFTVALDGGTKMALIAAAVFVTCGLVIVASTMLAVCCGQGTLSRRAACGWRDFKIILLMLFCETPPPPPVAKHEKVDIIPVVFNAWEYAGCDVLWAGIIKNIFDQVQDVFGKWKLRVYRTFADGSTAHRHDLSMAEVSYERNINTFFGKSFRSGAPECAVPMEPKSHETRGTLLCVAGSTDATVHTSKFCHIPRPVLVMIGFGVAVVSLAVLLLFQKASPPKSGPSDASNNSGARTDDYVRLIAGALLGTTMASQLRNVWSFLRSTISSQGSQLETAVKKMRGPDLGSDLGFMHKVKLEVQKITSFVKLMERLYQKKFRILIVVDDLDKCESSRIVSILDAINVLLSDEDSLFVTLVAIDHNVVAAALGGEAADASAYLRRHVQMRFCMPELSPADLAGLLHKSFCTSRSCDSARCRDDSSLPPNLKWRLSDSTDVAAQDCEKPRIVSKARVASEGILRSKLRRRMMRIAMQEVQKCVGILPSAFYEVRHLCNMIFFAIYLWVDCIDVRCDPMSLLESKLSDICIKLTQWVIMTEQWPYRCSWILKHVDDMDDLALKSFYCRSGEELNYEDTSISSVYEHVRPRLQELENWRHWINKDSSAEHFDVALDAFTLTVRHLKSFRRFTVNLDGAFKQSISDHYKTRVPQPPCDLCSAMSKMPSIASRLCLSLETKPSAAECRSS